MPVTSESPIVRRRPSTPASRNRIDNRVLARQLAGIVDYYLHPRLRSGWGGPMNGQRERQRIVEALLRRLPPDAIVETGSFRGTTAAYLARLIAVPLFTVEREARFHGFASAALAGMPQVRCFQGDSRHLLLHLASATMVQGRSLFCYLDAHAQGDQPLAGEVEIIFRHWPRAVVMIDDFQVPDDAGYLYDTGTSGPALTIEYLFPAIAHFGLSTFFPAASSDVENAARRGCVLLVADADVAATMRGMPEIRELVFEAGAVAMGSNVPSEPAPAIQEVSRTLSGRAALALLGAADRTVRHLARVVRQASMMPGDAVARVRRRLDSWAESRTRDDALSTIRVDGLRIERVADEVRIVNEATEVAHVLNPSAATVFDLCDGTTSTLEMATAIQRRTGLPAHEAVVGLALLELADAGLIAIGEGAKRHVVGRSQVIQRLALSPVDALRLPVVESIES